MPPYLPLADGKGGGANGRREEDPTNLSLLRAAAPTACAAAQRATRAWEEGEVS